MCTLVFFHEIYQQSVLVSNRLHVQDIAQRGLVEYPNRSADGGFHYLRKFILISITSPLADSLASRLRDLTSQPTGNGSASQRWPCIDQTHRKVCRKIKPVF